MTSTHFSTFYTNLINNLTLSQALDEHYKINPQFTPWYNFDQVEVRNLIKSHDISHLIFGCDTSYMGEFMVQTWNSFGSDTNINPKDSFKYLTNKNLRSLVLPTNLFGYAITHILEFIKIRKLIKKQSKLMTKKWQYFEEELYINKTINQIRLEYGIVTL